jgi:hypothetical protein
MYTVPNPKPSPRRSTWSVRKSGFPFGAPGPVLTTVEADDHESALQLAEYILRLSQSSLNHNARRTIHRLFHRIPHVRAGDDVRSPALALVRPQPRGEFASVARSTARGSSAARPGRCSGCRRSSCSTSSSSSTPPAAEAAYMRRRCTAVRSVFEGQAFYPGTYSFDTELNRFVWTRNTTRTLTGRRGDLP